MNIFLCFFIIILKEIISSNNKIYRIPFGLFKQENSGKDSDIINNIVTNGKYINLSIGTPSQNVPFELDTTCQTFSVSNKTFDRNESITYEQISVREAHYNYEIVENGYTSRDVLNIDNSINKSINFIYGTKFLYSKRNNIGVIGLLIPNRVQYGAYPFFESLKLVKLVNLSIWTLKFFDNISLFDMITYNKEDQNIIGELIFGDEPSKYENDTEKYNSSEYQKIHPLSDDGDIFWTFEFSNIYLTFKEKKNDSKIYFLGRKAAEIIINFSFMIGPTYFFDFIKENFFSKYLSEHICFERGVEFFYTYIECESSLKIDSFPDISFEHSGFETTFKLTYKDLFVEDKSNNKFYFLILKRYNYLDWVLGTVFLRKFQFVFDIDSKTIGYYRQPQKDKEENKPKNGDGNNPNNSNIIKIFVISILLVIFSILFIVLGMVIQKKFCNKDRRLRANELDDNFNYESHNDDNNILAINDDKKLIKEDDDDKNT